jgi:hypothetical protein
MNTNPAVGRRRLVIAAVVAVLLSGAVVLLTTVRSSSSNEKTGADTRQAALVYAQCMRDNGVPDFPAPDPNGRFTGLSHDKQDDPTFRAAQEKCRALAPGGEHEKSGDPAFVNQMRAYSQCMRDNGVPDFPDPDADGRLRGSGHEQQDDPKYRAAAEACRPKLPGGGEHR